MMRSTSHRWLLQTCLAEQECTEGGVPVTLLLVFRWPVHLAWAFAAHGGHQVGMLLTWQLRAPRASDPKQAEAARLAVP